MLNKTHYSEFVGIEIVDFFNAESAKDRAEGRRVSVPHFSLISVPVELILPMSNFQDRCSAERKSAIFRIR